MESNLDKCTKFLPLIYKIIDKRDCAANMTLADNNYQASFIFGRKVVRFRNESEDAFRNQLERFAML